MADDLDVARQKAGDYALLFASQAVLKNNPLGDYFRALTERDVASRNPVPEEDSLPVTLHPEMPQLPAKAPSSLPPAPRVVEASEPSPAKEKGSSGAIFEARIYVLSCLEKGNTIQKRVVANLTGMADEDVGKFISALHEEARQKGLIKVSKAKPKPWESSEDSEEEAPSTTEGETPAWWTPEKQRHCQVCEEPLPIRRIGKYFQSEGQYEHRRYCSRTCAGKGRKQGSS